jgi:polyphosphate glucokinase
MRAVGVDIGGSGIKAAVVDNGVGDFVTERVRVATPKPGEPGAILAATQQAIAEFPPGLPVGLGFPGPIVDGRVMTAAHVSDTWIGHNAVEAFQQGLGRPCTVINDADAAGLAEVRFGQGADCSGVVLLLTLGTGIGSALFIDGTLVPNTELGHIEVRGMDGEMRAAASRRNVEGLTWKEWAGRLEEFITRVDRLIWPDLVILGGGVSRKSEKFMPYLNVRPKVVPALLKNRAGIIGAACRAIEVLQSR